MKNKMNKEEQEIYDWIKKHQRNNPDLVDIQIAFPTRSLPTNLKHVANLEKINKIKRVYSGIQASYIVIN